MFLRLLTVSYWEPVSALLLSPVFCCFLKLLKSFNGIWDKMVPYLTEHSVKVNSGWFTEEAAKHIDVLWRSPGEGNGNPLQYSCHAWSHGQGSLVGYSPCVAKTWAQLSTHTHGMVLALGDHNGWSKVLRVLLCRFLWNWSFCRSEMVTCGLFHVI